MKQHGDKIIWKIKIGLLGWLLLLVCNTSVYGWRAPVDDPISSDYGPRNYGGYDWHEGIDYASPHGTPVYPVENGTITGIYVKGVDLEYMLKSRVLSILGIVIYLRDIHRELNILV